MNASEWSIQEVARAAGTTSRTLRHYGELGLLGLGLPAVAEVLDGQRDVAAALRTHLSLLETERERIVRQIASVRTTLDKTKTGEQIVPTDTFDGFDHTQYAQEVTERWGPAAYESGDRWWRSLSGAEQEAFRQQQLDIAGDFGRAAAAGSAPDSAQVQDIARRHVDWLSASTTPTKDYLTGLGQMYVDDARFAANYDRHGAGTAVLVRDALKVYAERNL